MKTVLNIQYYYVTKRFAKLQQCIEVKKIAEAH